MFNNIGTRLKTVAKIFCWIGIALSGISGIILITSGLQAYKGGGINILIGLLVIILGSLFSWIGSLGLYGFGELIENSDIQTNLAVKYDMEQNGNLAEQTYDTIDRNSLEYTQNYTKPTDKMDFT